MSPLYQIDKVRASNKFTFLDIYQKGETLQDSRMTNEEVRRENARWLSQQCGGPTTFAEKVGIAGARVSHLIGPNPVKNIGTATARRIEGAFEKPVGWLDIPNAWKAESIGGAQAKDSDIYVRAVDVMELFDLFQQVDDEVRRRMLAAMRAMARNANSRAIDGRDSAADDM